MAKLRLRLVPEKLTLESGTWPSVGLGIKQSNASKSRVTESDEILFSIFHHFSHKERSFKNQESPFLILISSVAVSTITLRTVKLLPITWRQVPVFCVYENNELTVSFTDRHRSPRIFCKPEVWKSFPLLPSTNVSPWVRIHDVTFSPLSSSYSIQTHPTLSFRGTETVVCAFCLFGRVN